MFTKSRAIIQLSKVRWAGSLPLDRRGYIEKTDLKVITQYLFYFSSNTLIKHRIAEIDKSVSKKEAELVKLRKQNAQNSAKLNAMSDAELSSAFTELFN